uniref:Uncharacterized protein n=1 Tax=Chromera velia CCMP2878 TaxID=1169474 RepID=A0A0G4FCR7_9ALVE|eukprot:Cvel_16276.t1-p1 / transcript=Cvel_16276.t1 / gene=Cvel_16276 / organism=Chromera_velia_CCMP2878 / gene_product=hypothetical protein / transcript_product=hypothetical protein / location=Cvel_scaffold1246:11685-12365(+) / protein_length=227 / sequence_SO=supercontig / SO=protein_coding / is_pseudo=false
MQFRFFVGDPLNTEVRRGQPEDFLFSRPLRLVVLTSIRDVGASDRCGSFIDVRCPHEGEWGSSIQLQCRKRYLKGALETLVEETTKPEGRLFGRFHLVGIVVDDVPQRDGVEAAGYTIVPQPCSSNENQKRRWILDGSLKVAPEEKCVRDLVWHVPSEWRKLPLEDEERKIGKWRWEGKVEAICLGLNADIVLSDHLMVVLERLVESEALRGKLLNIHPGITLEKGR